MVDFYDIFEQLGYTRANLEKRFRIYNNAALAGTLICRRNWSEDIDIEICGSRGEGLENSLESDFDVVFIQRSVKCFEKINLSENTSCSMIFTLDFENVPAGYTKLLLESSEAPNHRKNLTFLKNMEESLWNENGAFYLSNTRTLTAAIEYRKKTSTGSWVKQHLQFDDISGPSRPFKFKIPVLDIDLNADFVQALPCKFPSLVEAWCIRDREFDWPSNNVIEEIKLLDVLVVPVGMKGSRGEALQWRVSMTLAERALVRSFKDLQIKIYKAVKIVVKQELKPICNDISSYVVKNITFWVFEKTNLDNMTKQSFDHLFVTVLTFFKECIIQKEVQCYTIPSRNLLEHRITENQTRELTKRLDVMISEGIFTLLRCPLVIGLALQTRTSIISILYSEMVEKSLMSLFALHPSLVNLLERFLNNAKSSEEILVLYKHIVLPYIKETNPFGYFDLVKNMTTEQFFCYLYMIRHMKEQS